MAAGAVPAAERRRPLPGVLPHWSAGRHPDLAGADNRWPRFVPAATKAGFRTVHALPMRRRAHIIGAFNLFHTGPHQLDRRAPQHHHDTPPGSHPP